VSRQSTIRILQVATGILLGTAAALWWLGAPTGGSPGRAALGSNFLPAPLPAPNFVLTSQSGDRVSPRDFPGKILVVFFGYTSCPDVCPLTLTHLTRAFGLMGEDGKSIQVLLITVDPRRDTPERLRSYLANFHPSFLGLTGSEDEIRSVASAFGASFSRAGEGEDYTVDHTARSFVIDREGKIVLTFPVSSTPEEMAKDLTRLLKGYDE